jgi:AcrR family transcriptional regulator
MNVRLKMKNKREAILQATLELITTNGIHATPMSEVAKQAGVAAGTIYHYFESKTELINDLYAVLKQRMGEALMQNTEGQTSVKDRFFRFWLNLYGFFVQNPKEFDFLENYAQSPVVSEDVKKANEVHYSPVIAFLAEGIQKGVLREMPVALMTALVYGNVVAAAKLHLYGGFPLQPAHLQQAMQASWDGVRIN